MTSNKNNDIKKQERPD